MKSQNQSEMPLAHIEAAPLARAEPSVGELMQAVIANGVTPENAAALEKLCDLKIRLDDRAAQREFATAFVALQADLPTITAQTVILNRGKYERFEDIMKVIAKPLATHGFAVSFSQDFKDNRILEVCTLRHIGGHSQSNTFAVRSGKADSDTQADCKAATTAKRNALCNALNIVIRQDCLSGEDDSDAKIIGDCITPEQADDIQTRVESLHLNLAAFNEFTGSKTFRGIPALRYNAVIKMLRDKEAKK